MISTPTSNPAPSLRRWAPQATDSPVAVVRRPHVLPYIASVPARPQRKLTRWNSAILVGTVLALVVATAVAAAVIR